MTKQKVGTNDANEVPFIVQNFIEEGAEELNVRKDVTGAWVVIKEK